MVPQQPKTLPPIEVESGVLPQKIASSVIGKFTATNGRTFLFAAYPLARQSGQLSTVDAIVLATTQPGTFAALRYFIWSLFIAAAIILVVSLLIAMWLARSISNPLAAFKKAAQQISHGDYRQRNPYKGSKEIRELADSFSQMTENVEQSQLRLRHFVADVSHE